MWGVLGTYLRTKHPTVSWYRLVLGPDFISMFSFIVWLTMHNKLAVKARLINRGMVQDDKCVLCNSVTETIDHLFFECVYTASVWKNLLTSCRIQGPILLWRREVSWFSRRTKGKLITSRSRRILFAAMIYWTWRFRNEVIIKGIHHSSHQLYMQVKDSVALKFLD